MSSEYSGEESETDLEELPLRPKSSRKRILRTAEDESTEDEEFWNMEIFQEKPDDNKNEYQYLRQSDKSDSDISESNSETEGKMSEEGEKEDILLLQEERLKSRKAKIGVYKDPLLSLRRKKRPDTAKLTPRRKKRQDTAKLTPRKKYSMRKSTAAKSEATRQQMTKTPTEKHKKEKRVRIKRLREEFSQQQLLEAAKINEEENLRSLKELTSKDQFQTKKSQFKNNVLGDLKPLGAFLRLKSTPKEKTLSFFGSIKETADAFPSKTREDFYSTAAECYITRRSAVYRDPESSLPFSDSKSFGKLRELLGKGVVYPSKRAKMFRKSHVIRIPKPKNWISASKRKFSIKMPKYKALILVLKNGKIRIDLRRNKIRTALKNEIPLDEEKADAEERNETRCPFRKGTAMLNAFVQRQKTYMQCKSQFLEKLRLN